MKAVKMAYNPILDVFFIKVIPNQYQKQIQAGAAAPASHNWGSLCVCLCVEFISKRARKTYKGASKSSWKMESKDKLILV